jgi:hypothetical protein
MGLSRTSKAGLTVVLGLGGCVWLVTVVAFCLFSEADSRNGRWLFALGYLSFLEWLAVAYFAVPFIPMLRKRLVAALYPVFGLVIGVYALRALVMMLVTHTVPFLDTPRSHMLSAMLGLLPFLALMGVLFVLNTWQGEQTEIIRAERADLALNGAEVAEIYHAFVECHSHIGEAAYHAIEPVLKKLKERLQFCTPFHRQPAGAPQMGEEIKQRLTLLRELVGGLPQEGKSDRIETLRQTVTQLLQLIDRREKLLVK